MKESTNGPLKNYLLLSNGKKRDRCIKIEEGKKWEFMIVMIQSKVTQQRTKKKMERIGGMEKDWGYESSRLKRVEEDKGKDIKDRLKCGKGREVVARTEEK